MNTLQLKAYLNAVNVLSRSMAWIGEGGKIADANVSFLNALQYDREEVRQKWVFDILPEANLLAWKQLWRELRQNRQTSIKAQLMNAGGESFAASIELFLLDPGPQPICLFCFNPFSGSEEPGLPERQSKPSDKEAAYIKLEGTPPLYDNFREIVTNSKAYLKVLKQIEQVGQTSSTVLILGETGTGKELLAQAVHKLSSRKNQPLVRVNCAALPAGLVESELFGHEKGSFTGATARKRGRFELAHGSTIFLDEIGELPMALQPKLLRVLQEGEFERIGSEQSLKADVRVIAATNRKLEKLVREGQFREDLYYRLNVFPIYNIPLRERKEDIPLLVSFFAEKYSKRIGRRIESICRKALRQLMDYPFPGNVRELENIVERAVILSSGNVLNLQGSMPEISCQLQQGNDILPPLEEVERTHILKALHMTGYRATGPRGAARLLGIKDQTLASKMRRLGIRKKDVFNRHPGPG